MLDRGSARFAHVRGARSSSVALVVAVALLACGRPSPLDERASAAPRASASAAPAPETLAAKATAASAAVAASRRFVDVLDVSKFAKGNLHTHSRASDGDSPPRRVYEWYRDHGYAFVALTDHNQRVDPTPFRDVERPGFVLLPGEEVTMGVNGTAVHVNAICARAGIGVDHPKELYAFLTNKDALAWAIDHIAAEGGVALLNHPNYMWALTSADLVGLPAAPLLEMWSGHPHVHAEGDARRPSEEAIWEDTLRAGVDYAPVSVDDTHSLHGPIGQPAPGRGWVQVFTDDVSERSICDALARGRLYASSGASLKRIQVEGDTMTVTPESATAKVEFIGPKGVLATLSPRGEPAVYRLQGDESYVRARITDMPHASQGARGGKAWTRAYRTALPRERE